MKLVRILTIAFTYLLRRITVFVVGLAAFTLLTFLVTGNLNGVAYSERMFWVSIAVFMVAGMMAFAQMLPGRVLMFPYNIRRPEDAKKFVDSTTEYRESADKRFDIGIQIWLIGLGCFAISALVQTLTQ